MSQAALRSSVNGSEKGERAGARKASDRRGHEKSASAFRTISEVADDLGVQQHVLRFWESKFPQVKPLKRGGGRRYYRPEDVELLRCIHHLLYVEGYTIRGVQKLLHKSKNAVLQATAAVTQGAIKADEAPVAQESQQPAAAKAKAAAPVASEPTLFDLLHETPAQTAGPEAANVTLSPEKRRELKALLDELKALRQLVAERETQQRIAA